MLQGLGKSRKGSPSIGLEQLIHKTKMSAFVKAAVSADEALDAAKMLSVDKKTRVRRYAESGAIGGAAYPVISAAGEVAGALAGPKGQRLQHAASAARKAFSRPEVAKSVTRGVLGGGGIQAIREGVEIGKAKKTVKGFLDQHRGGQ